jgi:hypothetical protein
MSMKAIQFQLLRDPPTSSEIEWAKAELTKAIQSTCRKRRNAAVARFTFALLAGASAGAYWQSWWSAWAVFCFLAVVFGLMASAAGEPDEVRQLLELEPVSIWHLGDILRACELDLRVDAYRCKVAQQPREMVVAEAIACRYWKDYGYEESRNWAIVRSPRPLEREDVAAGDLAGATDTAAN